MNMQASKSPKGQQSARGPGRWFHLAGVTLAGIAVVGALSLASLRRRAEARETQARDAVLAAGPRVLAATAQSAPPTRMLMLQGDVRALRQATIYAKVSGYLKSIRVERGDLVAHNDILGLIESPESEQQELSARAELLLRNRTERRVRSLIPSGVLSAQDLDNASSGLSAARAEAARIHALRGYEVLRAPFAGRVTARYVNPGAMLPAATGATQSAQPVLDIADTSRVRIFVYPGALDAPLIHEGNAVTFWTDADPARKRAAKVTHITHALDPRTRTMLAEIDVDNEDGSLDPGSYAHVQITVPTIGGVVMPADALTLRGGKPYVAMIVDHRATFRLIEVGDDDGKSVRVVSGLAVGDQVVVHPSDDVLEGAMLQVGAPKDGK